MRLKIILLKRLELMSKRLSKYIAFFNYFVKLLFALSATSGSISVASFATVIGTPAGIVSGSFSLVYLMSTGIVKKNVKNHTK